MELSRGDRPFFFLATDKSGRGKTSGGGGEYTGLLQSEDQTLLWLCSTVDGVAGTIVIDDQEFELTRGRLFLVRSESAQLAVDQVDVPLEKLFEGSTTGGFSDEAKSLPEVARFLNAVSRTIDDSKN